MIRFPSWHPTIYMKDELGDKVEDRQRERETIWGSSHLMINDSSDSCSRDSVKVNHCDEQRVL